MINILVVEDDRELNHIMCTYLEKSGYEVKGCANPLEAYEVMHHQPVDLIISDILMPKEDGFSFAEKVRAGNPLIPILFITALDDLSSKQKGFSAGVDDYMVKPVDMDEMVLRVRALLRRAQIQNENQLVIGNVTLVKDEMAAYLNGTDTGILPREFSVLWKLLSHPKKIFTRSELMDEYWNMGNETGLRTVDVYIAKLRKEFAGADGFEIVTVQGFGYKAVLK